MADSQRQSQQKTKYPSLIHERVALARAGENPAAICRVKSGWVVLGDDQRLPGYTLLLADPVRDSINDLDMGERAQFFSDMTAIGDALIETLEPSIINYSILGNTDRALHVHTHPRYNDEEPEMRKTHAIAYHWHKMPYVRFDIKRDRPLIDKIRAALAKYTEIIE